MNIRWSKIAKNSNDILLASNDGFDSVEMSIDYLVNMSEEEFLFQKNLMREKNIFCETCNCLLPKTVKVAEDGFNIYIWIDYLKKAAIRASGIGCKRFVWSEGLARLLPEDDDSGYANEQVIQFIYMTCELLKHYKIELLIEPLSQKQTNYINNIQEVKQLIDIISKDNFASALSINNLSKIGFEENDFEKFSNIINHIYLDDSKESLTSNYSQIFMKLKKVNYKQLFSLPNSANKKKLEYYKEIFNNL